MYLDMAALACCIGKSVSISKAVTATGNLATRLQPAVGADPAHFEYLNVYLPNYGKAGFEQPASITWARLHHRLDSMEVVNSQRVYAGLRFRAGVP